MIAVLTGLGIALGVVVLGAIPLVVLQVTSPTGSPFPFADLPMVAMFAAVGAAIGLIAAVAQTRALRGGVTAALVLVVAFWLSSAVWPAVTWLPTPPLLPMVPASVTFAAGVLIGAWLRPRLLGTSSTDSPVAGAVLGAIGAGGLLAVTELQVWAIGVSQRTFVGPGGMSLPLWLGIVFLLVVLAGALVGLVVASRDRRAGLVALLVTLVPVAAIHLTAGLGGQPRTIRYGLGLGVLLVAALLGPRRATSDPDAQTAAPTGTTGAAAA